MKNILIVFIVLSLTEIFPQSGQAGAFLRRGLDSKAIAIGGAYTSVTDGASSIYWNPAGLSGLKGVEFTGMYSFLTLDRAEYFASMAYNISDILTLGAGLYRFGVNDIDGRDADGFQTKKFNDSENSIMLGVGKEFLPFDWSRFSFGITIKYLIHSLYDNSASGLGFDLGFQTTLLEQFRVGIVLQDQGSTLKWDTDSETEEKIPSVLRFGISYFPEYYPVFIAVDYYKISGSKSEVRTGAGIKLFNSFGVKAGYNGEDPSFGLFILVPSDQILFQVDYAASRDVLENNYVHYLTVSFKY